MSTRDQSGRSVWQAAASLRLAVQIDAFECSSGIPLALQLGSLNELVITREPRPATRRTTQRAPFCSNKTGHILSAPSAAASAGYVSWWQKNSLAYASLVIARHYRVHHHIHSRAHSRAIPECHSNLDILRARSCGDRCYLSTLSMAKRGGSSLHSTGRARARDAPF